MSDLEGWSRVIEEEDEQDEEAAAMRCNKKDLSARKTGTVG